MTWSQTWLEFLMCSFTFHNGPLALVGLALGYALVLTIYRLYCSPLSKFPGPRVASLTWGLALSGDIYIFVGVVKDERESSGIGLAFSDLSRYQFYHDIVRRGQYIWVVQSMHAKYGPIVRINPSELHICNSSFYDTLYAAGGTQRKREKWAWDNVGAAGVADSTLSTIDHDRHRMRRSAIAPFFSTQNVRKLQPVIQAKVDTLFQRLMDLKATGNPVNLSHAFSALTNDVIMEYCFARSSSRLEAPDFDPTYKNASHRGVRMAQIAKHLRPLTWIAKALLYLPQSWAEKLGPAFRMFLVERRILTLERDSASTGPDAAHVTVFRELLDSKLPSQEKQPRRLAAEAQVLVSAGSETTAKALTFATYSLLTSPVVLQTLKVELETAIPGSDPAAKISLEQIQHLPYLSAVIKESLRLTYGVVGRLARIWPREEIRFGEWSIPAGTPVSMTSYDVHHDEGIFKDSFHFNPQRWIDNPGLDRYLVSFGKGTRQCLGMNLAYAEMYLTLARLFMWFGCSGVRKSDDVGVLELFETDETDVKMVAEVLVPFVEKGSKGVRVVILP